MTERELIQGQVKKFGMIQSTEKLEIEYRKCFKAYIDEHTQIGDLLTMAMDINNIQSLLAIAPEVKKAQAKMNEALSNMGEIEQILRQLSDQRPTEITHILTCSE